jgi:hypothetical protein
MGETFSMESLITHQDGNYGHIHKTLGILALGN